MVSRSASTATRGGANGRVNKATAAAPAAAPVPRAAAGGEAEAEAEEAGELEQNTGTEAVDPAVQEHPGVGEEDLAPQEEISENGAAAHEEPEPAHEVPDHEEAPPQGDAAAEPDADPSQSQNQAAGDHAEAGQDGPSEQASLPGEKEAEHHVSETEAEATPEHEARLDEVKRRHPTDSNELESIMNMLEGHPPFPSSTHLDVAGEIPDEE